MELVKDKKFGGERPLFACHDLRLENVTITDGESGIKQCQNMEAYNCKFYGKYLGGMSISRISRTATLLRARVLPSGIPTIW